MSSNSTDPFRKLYGTAFDYTLSRGNSVYFFAIYPVLNNDLMLV